MDFISPSTTAFGGYIRTSYIYRLPLIEIPSASDDASNDKNDVFVNSPVGSINKMYSGQDWANGTHFSSKVSIYLPNPDSGCICNPITDIFLYVVLFIIDSW